MAKKPDLTKVKTFFFEKGEKVGLGICLLAMVAIVGLGGMSSVGQSSAGFVEKLKAKSDGIKSAVAGATIAEEELQGIDKIKIDPWPPRNSYFQVTPFNYLPDRPRSKRTNPSVVLPVRAASAEAETMRIDYVRGLYFAYEIDPAKNGISIVAEGKDAGGPGVGPIGAGAVGTGTKSSVKPAIIVKPIRMNVVSATYPLQDELVVFAQNLNLTLGELFAPANRHLLPRFLGINVKRCEVGPDGKATPWIDLIRTDIHTGKTEVARSIKDVLREALFDETTVRENARYVHPGLVTPLPLLAFGSYPRLTLKDMEPFVLEDVAQGPGVMPGPGPGPIGPKGINMPMVKLPGVGDPAANVVAAPENQFTTINWNKLPRDLRPLKEKFEGGTYIFDANGIAPDAEERKKAGTFIPGMVPPPATMQPGSGPDGAAGASRAVVAPWDLFEDQPKKDAKEADDPPPPAGFNPGLVFQSKKIKLQDALVRFFDPDVQPGKTYRYSVQVRMANPNYGQKETVAYSALAEIKELPPSDFTTTPDASIPGEYFFYAVDQMPRSPIHMGANYEPTKGDFAAVQIHRWIDQYTDWQGLLHVIGDWTILERLLVRKGEPIGKNTVMVEVPEWKKGKSAFDVGYSAPPMLKKSVPGAKEPPRSGIPIDFLISSNPPILVDFEGGRREEKFLTLPGFPIVRDESAIDLLILNPNGKLVVRNSRLDTDPDHRPARERAERVRAWADRVQAAKAPAAGVRPGGPAMPIGPKGAPN